MNDVEIRMEKRQDTILEVREKMNTVEDRIFTDFCSQIGVDNIRWVGVFYGWSEGGFNQQSLDDHDEQGTRCGWLELEHD